MNSTDYGLPRIILDLLAGKHGDETLHMTWNIFNSGNHTELRLTWLPKHSHQSVSGIRPRHKHLPPSKIRRNNLRREKYFNEIKEKVQNNQTVSTQCVSKTPVKSNHAVDNENMIPGSIELSRDRDTSISSIPLQSSPVSIDTPSHMSSGLDESVFTETSISYTNLPDSKCGTNNVTQDEQLPDAGDFVNKYDCGHEEDLPSLQPDPLYLCSKCAGNMCPKCYGDKCLIKHRSYLKLIRDT